MSPGAAGRASARVASHGKPVSGGSASNSQKSNNKISERIHSLRPGSPLRPGENLLIVAGEHSGDLLGGDLVQALQRKWNNGVFFGTGGDSLKAAGVDLLHTVETMNVLGFWEGIKAVPRLKRVAAELMSEVERRQVRTAILIDSPGFNLRLAEMLKKTGVKVIFLVSPQIWAWKYNRVKKIRKYVDLMLTLFPFEKEIYDREGIRAECIGHPMVQRIPRDLRRDEPIAPVARKKNVALLPGSRRSEVFRLLRPMLEAAERLHKRYSGIRFMIPVVGPELTAFVEAEVALHPDLPVKVFQGRSLRIMESADLVILASGTATLEVAWFKKPMVILYQVNLFNFLLASLLLRVPWIGLVNLLAGHQIVLELLQSEVTAETIEREATRIFEDTAYREQMVAELELVRRRMGRGSPAASAATFIDEFLNEKGNG